jgi:phenylpropionate dioxygenase-like ring-hydroxylating dioxygenase large terminal subunit
MWVRLVDSGAVAPGAIVDASVPGEPGGFDRDLVVWRTFDGDACVMEARCPHQWSHLGAEGFVDGDEIVCTAHFWRFTTDGTGTKLNVNGRRDVKADIDVVPSEERDGAVWIRLDSPL